MRLIVLFAAILIAAGAFFATMHFIGGNKPGVSEESVVVNVPTLQQQVPTVNIYMARQDIPIGSQLKQEMLDIQPWPQHLLLPDMVPADPSKPNDLIRMVARAPFQRGEPIMKTMLGNENDPSFLAAELGAGMRAITIAVDVVAGGGGFVYPGDRVDVIATHDVKLGSETDERPSGEQAQAHIVNNKGKPIAEVLIPNVRVLATNQKAVLHNGEPPMPPSNVTLEVTSQDAQKIRLVDNGNGRLSLALRPLKEKDNMQMARPTGISDLSRLTPPAYFPVIYGPDGKPIYSSGEEEGDTNGGVTSMIVTRGTQEQEVGVSRP